MYLVTENYGMQTFLSKSVWAGVFCYRWTSSSALSNVLLVNSETPESPTVVS